MFKGINILIKCLNFCALFCFINLLLCGCCETRLLNQALSETISAERSVDELTSYVQNRITDDEARISIVNKLAEIKLSLHKVTNFLYELLKQSDILPDAVQQELRSLIFKSIYNIEERK